MSAVINCVAYAGGQREQAVDIADICEVLQRPGRFVWIGLHEPDEDLLEQVQAAFGLHDLAIEDAHRAHQRPKIEVYGESLFIVLRTVQMNGKENKIEFGETHFFVGLHYIVTVRHGSSLPYTDVRMRCESTPHLLKKGPGFALYALMDAIVDQYFPVVDALEHQLQALEEVIFGESFSRETTARIYGLKRELLEVKRAISPLIDICNRLMRFDLEVLPPDTRPYFRDVYDHTIRINEMVDTLRELLTTALEANFSLISITQNEVMKTQNEVMKRFGGWAAIFAIPTMVAGIYGMNFQWMPELNWRYGYPVVLTLAFGLCLGLYIHFKRSGWF
ncbi:magnesium/cobalt transporter CorA [Rhodocytophaga rosea]|uniref:Magnesium transport protein CorA n=1 Tax=Rhodocytophaga rosea TaxID=2704465 RepID=A0A6C0GRQ1_9BACT|nr:magnesium/cobalt transporter CorA [Rhodocytophaga rosea]QHT70222.1 magnesium/cobalt transporter CorA [Rhodocytophaga rosea]